VLKKIGFAAATTAAGLVMLGGMASADPGAREDFPFDGNDQAGLVNLNNTDILHNVNAVVGVCDNNINVLGIQVNAEDIANGLAIPLLSEGFNEAEADGDAPDLCATGGIVDGGSMQEN